MNALVQRLLHPPVNAPAAVILLRLMAGGIFLSEGILKFVYPNQGVGRFTKLGFPAPYLTATFVAWLEIIGGILLILGLFTSLITIPFIIEMIVATLSTKITLFLGTYPLALPSSPPTVGFWAVMHEARSEYGQLMTVIFLLIVGPGLWSVDAYLERRRKPETRPVMRSVPSTASEHAR
ncbi:MAG: DoxX family protein [Herpetosiphonaceae bacterium]|nr:DoxX family protein [Herpetosiphonaceae bacterium]